MASSRRTSVAATRERFNISGSARRVVESLAYLRRRGWIPPALVLVSAALAAAATFVVEISPDGTKLAFGSDGALWVQKLDQLWNPRRLAGTEGDGWPRPAWSPDSRFLALLRDEEIRRVDVDSGRVLTLSSTPAPGMTNVAWSLDGDFVLVHSFVSGDPEFFEIPASGGAPRTTQFRDLPVRFSLFGSRGRIRGLGEIGSMYRSRIVVWDELGGQLRELCFGDQARYAASDHLVFANPLKPAGIWAMPFSGRNAEPKSDAFPVAPGGMSPSVSEDGTLVYAVVPQNHDRLLLLDRHGERIRSIGAPQSHIGYPAFSPDGSRVAVWGFEAPTESDWGLDIWIHEVDRPVKSRLTMHSEVDLLPRWRPNHNSISFSSDRSNKRDVYVKAVDSSLPAEPLLLGADSGQWLVDWSDDGRRALVHRISPPAQSDPDLVVLDAESGLTTPLMDTKSRENNAAFSPDGLHVAFTSDRSGRMEVYVCPVDTCDENLIKVSSNGGEQVRWARDKGSIYYVENHSRMMEVEAQVSASSEIQLSEPREIFESPYLWIQACSRLSYYDVTEDGEQFVVVEPTRGQTTKESPGVIHVWQNWAAAFAERE